MITVRAADSSQLRVVLKTYGAGDPEGDGTWAATAGRRLEAAGFGEGSPFQVARTHGARPGFLLCAHAPGMLWREAVGTAGNSRASELVGAWHAALQATALDLPVGRTRGPEVLAEQLPELEAVGGPAAPLVRARLGELLDRLREPQPLMPSHGNAHPQNFFVDLAADPPVTTAIDLDTIAAREPAHDIGYAIAHALIRSRRRPGPEHGYTAAQAVLHGYRRAGGVAPNDRVAVQTARAIVQAMHHEAVILRRGQHAVAQDLPIVGALLDEGITALRPLPARP